MFVYVAKWLRHQSCCLQRICSPFKVFAVCLTKEYLTLYSGKGEYSRFIDGTSVRESVTAQCSTTQLSQPRPNEAAPVHRDIAREKVVNNPKVKIYWSTRPLSASILCREVNLKSNPHGLLSVERGRGRGRVGLGHLKVYIGSQLDGWI